MDNGGGASRSLLLLPPPPSPPSFLHLKAAYGPAFSHVLSELASLAKGTSTPQVLDVALSKPDILVQSRPRTNTYSTLQELFAGLYKLICVAAAQASVELDSVVGIDARVIIVDTRDASFQNSVKHPALQGPVVDLPTLVFSNRPYASVFCLESEEGEAFFRTFSNLASVQPARRRLPTTRRVPGGVTAKMAGSRSLEAKIVSTSRSHYSVAVGGTFDHLHIGHKLLLAATALLIEPEQPKDNSIKRLLTIGITGDELLVNKKYAEVMESWEERQTRVADFLESILILNPPGATTRKVERVSNPGPNGKYVRVHFDTGLAINYVQISDPFGPTVTDETISALAISKETRAGGKAINDKREEKGWAPLEVFEVDVLDAEEEVEKDPRPDNDFQAKLSSTEIRRQEFAKLKGNL